MNKEQREVYRLLAGEVNYAICSFCRYGSFNGSPCSEGGEYECDHPLSDRYNFPFQQCLEPLSDCWGFRPDRRFTVADCADIVGVIIANKFDGNTQWSHREDGKIEVIGRSAGGLA